MFILDIEPFFHQAVREADTVALMCTIGHQQIKQASRAGQSTTSEFTQRKRPRLRRAPALTPPLVARSGRQGWG